MKKTEIKAFFDQCAKNWDDRMVKNDNVITKILDNADVNENIDVLDVACGTGVLFPYYLERKVSSVVGIDFSSEMVKIAKEKFPNIEVICSDVENYFFAKKFDRVIVYNAFPHFSNPKQLIKVLSKAIKPGGILSIAHGMSRDKLLEHHLKKASDISIELLNITDACFLLEEDFEVVHAISNNEMYQLVGKKKNK